MNSKHRNKHISIVPKPTEAQSYYQDEYVKASFVRNGKDIEIKINSTAFDDESLEESVKRILGALKYKLENF